jgi:N-methylhydantoinase B
VNALPRVVALAALGTAAMVATAPPAGADPARPTEYRSRIDAIEPPVEVIEAENPLLIEEYGFLPDTGGPGKYRGGLGVVRQYRLLNETATVQQRADRHLYPCWGLFGGKPGALSKSYFIRDGKREESPAKFARPMKKGEVFRSEMAGSGGYGDPFERDPEAVAEDVRQEKITLAHAEREYGVAVDPATLALDRKRTAALRGGAR